ncbi:MAG TPA: hypothetical protein VFW21_01360 [Mycobacterium sp.]|nr:hypothetical protein [Mycobacterium sp.]
MTTQEPDYIRLNGRSYVIAAVDGHGLVEPAALDIELVAINTGCWRGYLCEYSIVNDGLILEHLEVGSNTQPPPINGVAPIQGDEAWQYANLHRQVAFTGRLLAATGEEVVGDLNMMGYPPAWHYPEVLELVFEAGRLTSIQDRSLEAELVRSKPPTDNPNETPMERVKRAYSLSFAYSLPG